MTLAHSGAKSAVIPACAMVLVAALLAGCVIRDAPSAPQGSEPPPAASPTSASVLIYDGNDGEIRTICHNGRLLYVLNYYKGGGVAVVEDADECRATTVGEASQVGTPQGVNQNKVTP